MANAALPAASVNFTTLRSGLILGADSPLNITISSAVDGLTIFDVAQTNANIVAKLNTGDVFADDHIATDANEINAWAVFDNGDVGLGANEVTISGIEIQSTTFPSTSMNVNAPRESTMTLEIVGELVL